MTATVPDIEPIALTAGDSLTWTFADADYPSTSAPAWTLSYAIVGIDKVAWNAAWVTPKADNSFLVFIPISATTNLRGGSYTFIRFLTDGTSRPSWPLPPLNITTNPANIAAGQTRAALLEAALVVLDAAILGRLTDAMQGYMIRGRQVQFIPPKELRTERAALRAELASIRGGGTDPLGESVPYTFPRPSVASDSGQWV